MTLANAMGIGDNGRGLDELGGFLVKVVEVVTEGVRNQVAIAGSWIFKCERLPVELDGVRLSIATLFELEAEVRSSSIKTLPWELPRVENRAGGEVKSFLSGKLLSKGGAESGVEGEESFWSIRTPPPWGMLWGAESGAEGEDESWSIRTLPLWRGGVRGREQNKGWGWTSIHCRTAFEVRS